MSEKSSEIEKEESENPKIENIVEEHKEGVEEIKNSEIQVPSEEKAFSIEAETKPDTDNTVEFSNEAGPELISGTTDDKKPELAAGPKKIISKKDYKSFTPEELIDELKSLIESNPIQKIKNQVEEIRSEFNKAFKAKKKDDQEDFIKNGGDKDDYKFNSPLKKEFNIVFKDYKEKRSIYYQDLSKDLKANLEKRLALIEELKSLLNVEENINSTYKHFKEIQERWFECGPIPRDKYNIVWNTYRHHVENFYDFLHLNRKFRDMDFKHNLEEKLKLIDRAEKLKDEDNINKAFRELQQLHRLWKEEIGPVAKEHREEIWNRFSSATKVIHDRRHEYMKDMEQVFEENFSLKEKLIEEISTVLEKTKPNHQSWQKSIKKVQELRDQFFSIGRVPRSKNKELWNLFKEATRNFNKSKNTFYKEQKKEQHINLDKKLELINIAEENKDSDDHEVITPLMKKIQNDWKQIGHVPRKDSDKIWKQFKGACNYYFDRLNAQMDESNKEEIKHYNLKEDFLKDVSSIKLKGNKDEDVKTIKNKINEWKSIGRVPYNKRNIEQKFNKVLDGLFNKLDLDKKEAELIKFENRLNTFNSKEDEQKIQKEEIFINKKINESKDEIRQLENNLGFFQHVDENNPLVLDVNKNINRHKEDLEVWKAKLKKIRKLRKSIEK
jgi:hypothetical protein